MSEQRSNASSNAVAGGGAAPAGALPDINAETYPFDTVVRLLDQAAFLSMFSVPEKGRPGVITARDGSGVIGLGIQERLHRFSLSMEAPSHNSVVTHNMVG